MTNKANTEILDLPMLEDDIPLAIPLTLIDDIPDSSETIAGYIMFQLVQSQTVLAGYESDILTQSWENFDDDTKQLWINRANQLRTNYESIINVMHDVMHDVMKQRLGDVFSSLFGGEAIVLQGDEAEDLLRRIGLKPDDDERPDDN